MKKPTDKHPFKVGDRFKWNSGGTLLLWEVIEVMEHGQVLVLSGKQIGQHKRISILTNFLELYTYLGNFSKQENFTTLYNKLCESV